MKKTTIFLAMLAVTTLAIAQKKKTTTSATINFDATTSIDAYPKATNNTVVASINPKTGDVAFESIIKGFNFTNPKIQEHFNQPNWMDSNKYPSATFKGKISNLADINFAKDGTYTANVAGNLTIRGVTKPVTTTAKITVAGKALNTTTDFEVKLADYGVSGAAIGAGKVATDPKISVLANFK